MVSMCPVCKTNGIHASHRRGFFERGPLSWIGVLPFRCGQCNARFYRFAPGARRRRAPNTFVPTGCDELRPMRWSTNAEAAVTLYQEDGTTQSFAARVENASADGVGIVLPVTLPEASLLSVEIHGIPSRLGRVCWVKETGTPGVLHGIEFESASENPTHINPPSLAMRAQRVRRRIFVGMMCVALLALAAYGLVWLIEEFRRYRPRYYEPKDIERQQYQQRESGQTSPSPPIR